MTDPLPPNPPPVKPHARPILKFAGVVLLILLIAALFRMPSGGKETIPWRTDLAAAKGEAARDGKPVFAYFTATWCPPCQSLARTTWNDPTVAAALQNYVPVKIDVDAGRNLADDYHVESIPAFFILAADGSVQRRTVGASGPAEFVSWLKSER